MSHHLPVIMEQQTNQVLAAIDENKIETLLQLARSNLVENKLLLKIDVKLINEMIFIYKSWGKNLITVPIGTSFISNTKIDATKIANGIYYLSIDNIVSIKTINFIKIR